MKADEEDIAADAVGTARVGYVWRGTVVSGLSRFAKRSLEIQT